MAREAAGRDGIARKSAGNILKAMQEHTLAPIALYAGVSDSTISRWFSEAVEALAKALAYIGLKVVPADMMCVSPGKYLAYEEIVEEHVLANRARKARLAAQDHALAMLRDEDPE